MRALDIVRARVPSAWNSLSPALHEPLLEACFSGSGVSHQPLRILLRLPFGVLLYRFTVTAFTEPITVWDHFLFSPLSRAQGLPVVCTNNSSPLWSANPVVPGAGAP